MISDLPPGVVQLNNPGAGRPRRLESHQPSSFQPPVRQIVERDFERMPPSNQPIISPQPSLQYSPASLISPHNARTRHQPTPEPLPRRNIDVVDIRDDNITEAEARKRLSSYIVVRIEKSTDLYAIDDEGNPVSPTWEKASHTIQRDISRQEAGRKVRELNQETGPVSDKKNELPSALQRQLEHAWGKLADMESDRRFVYTLAQLDWKIKISEAQREHHRKREKRSKDKKRSKESSRSKPKKERVSMTAYFKREPSCEESCVSMYTRQQEDGKRDESPPLNGRSPMAIPAQPPHPRPAQFDPIYSPPQTRHLAFGPQVQCHFPLNQPPNSFVNHPNLPNVSTLPLQPPQQRPVPSPPIRIPSRRLPEDSSAGQLPYISWDNIPREDEGSNRRTQFNSSKMERQGTSGSQNSESSATSFSDLSSEDSNSNLTPHSSLENRFPHRHHEGGRERSRYRQHRNEESFGLEVAHQQKPRDSVDSYNVILPSTPDPVRAATETDILRRGEQRAYREGMMDGQMMARSMSVRNPSCQPQIIQGPLENRRDSFHDSSLYSLSSEDMDRLRDRLDRASLADEPRSRQEPIRDPAIHYEHREQPRRYRDDTDEGYLIPEMGRGIWRKQDAQRYMTSRQRSGQEAWDLGSTPLRYTENMKRLSDYIEYRQ
ncbi:hypothetical protein ACHAQJ_006388 [Trichoderma viride]